MWRRETVSRPAMRQAAAVAVVSVLFGVLVTTRVGEGSPDGTVAAGGPEARSGAAVSGAASVTLASAASLDPEQTHPASTASTGTAPPASADGAADASGHPAGAGTGSAAAVPPSAAGAEPAGAGDTPGHVADPGTGSPEPTVEPGTVTGTVRQLWAELALPGAAAATGEPHVELQTWVDTGGERFRLAGSRADELVSGSEVTLDLGEGTHDAGFPVEAVEVETLPEPAVLDGVELGSGETLDFGALPSAVTHEVTTVLAVPAGASPDSTTATSFRNTVAGPVASFWSSQSSGQRNIVVTGAHSWVSLASSCHGDPFALWNEVASKVGWSSGARKHLLVYLPTAAGCGAGLGTVGPTSESGGLMWTSHNSTDVVAHEIGHNLGLGHSNGLLCSATADGAYAGGWGSGCTVSGYRDWYDVMGISWGNLGTLAAPHADRLGLLSSTAKVTVATPTTVRLAPGGSSSLRVARIDDPGGAYYVEYRTAAGQDAWLTGNWRGLNPGVLVRRVNPANGRESLLLDPTVPGGSRSSDWTAALAAGDSLTTASGHARVTVRSADSAGATVDIAIGGQDPQTVSLPDGEHVALAMTDGATVDPGSVAFTGTARAPEGTLLWEVRDAGDAVRASGHATTGVDTTPGPFVFAVSLPSGSYTVRAWVPDESDGEASFGPGFSDEVSLTVR